MIDTSIVRVHQQGACITRNRRQAIGKSRGGLTSKIHAVVDSSGLPGRLALRPGEAHDVRLAEKLLSRLKHGSMLLADRGYDADWIRELAMKKGAWANIPPKSSRSNPICFSPHLYRARNQVERFFNRIKQCRRVATRYDRLAGTASPPYPMLPLGEGFSGPVPTRADFDGSRPWRLVRHSFAVLRSLLRSGYWSLSDPTAPF